MIPFIVMLLSNLELHNYIIYRVFISYVSGAFSANILNQMEQKCVWFDVWLFNVDAWYLHFCELFVLCSFGAQTTT